MATHFFLNGQRAESTAREGEIIEADDVLATNQFGEGRDVIMTGTDGVSKLVNPGSQLPAVSGTRFIDVPKGIRGSKGQGGHLDPTA
jgi:hypothetical protein